MSTDPNRRAEPRVLVRASMLPRVWPLRDVEDVEQLCRGVIAELAGRHGRGHGRSFVSFEASDFYEALAFLLGEAVIQEQQFDERPGIQFRPWLYTRLRFRLIDFWRSFYGRRGQHRVFDERLLTPDDELDDGDAGGDRHERAAADWRADPASGAAALEGVFALGDRGDPGPERGEGGTDHLGAGGGAAGRNGTARGGAPAAGRPASPSHVDCEACGWRTYAQAPNGVERWHLPERCFGCGEALVPEGAEVAA